MEGGREDGERGVKGRERKVKGRERKAGGWREEREGEGGRKGQMRKKCSLHTNRELHPSHNSSS